MQNLAIIQSCTLKQNKMLSNNNQIFDSIYNLHVTNNIIIIILIYAGDELFSDKNVTTNKNDLKQGRASSIYDPYQKM